MCELALFCKNLAFENLTKVDNFGKSYGGV